MCQGTNSDVIGRSSIKVISLKRVRDMACIATIAMVACTITITVAILRREILAASSPTPPVRVADWFEIANGGQRIGSEDAAVTLVTLGDFQCPTYVRLPRERRGSADSGEVIAFVVYRHWLLTRHRFAYPAARAAECAAQKGRFEAIHDVIFAKLDSPGLVTAGEASNRSRRAARRRGRGIVCTISNGPMGDMVRSIVGLGVRRNGGPAG